jgi:hypothetical protein
MERNSPENRGRRPAANGIRELRLPTLRRWQAERGFVHRFQRRIEQGHPIAANVGQGEMATIGRALEDLRTITLRHAEPDPEIGPPPFPVPDL